MTEETNTNPESVEPTPAPPDIQEVPVLIQGNQNISTYGSAITLAGSAFGVPVGKEFSTGDPLPGPAPSATAPPDLGLPVQPFPGLKTPDHKAEIEELENRVDELRRVTYAALATAQGLHRAVWQILEAAGRSQHSFLDSEQVANLKKILVHAA